MHAALSEPNMNAKILDIKLLNILQSFGSGNSLHSAHEEYLLFMQQARTLHQAALLFSRQPGHFPRRYRLQASQYKPQYATNFESEIISFIFLISLQLQDWIKAHAYALMCKPTRDV
jgi:hypothetical protein